MFGVSAVQAPLALFRSCCLRRSCCRFVDVAHRLCCLQLLQSCKAPAACLLCRPSPRLPSRSCCPRRSCCSSSRSYPSPAQHERSAAAGSGTVWAWRRTCGALPVRRHSRGAATSATAGFCAESTGALLGCPAHQPILQLHLAHLKRGSYKCKCWLYRCSAGAPCQAHQLAAAPWAPPRPVKPSFCVVPC